MNTFVFYDQFEYEFLQWFLYKLFIADCTKNIKKFFVTNGTRKVFGLNSLCHFLKCQQNWK